MRTTERPGVPKLGGYRYSLLDDFYPAIPKKGCGSDHFGDAAFALTVIGCYNRKYSPVLVLFCLALGSLAWYKGAVSTI
jgi:hypothetical protein